MSEVERGARLQGKVAVVTGAGGGIGSEIARSLAKAGADVVVHYATSEQAAGRVTEEIAALGRRALALRADVRAADEVAALFERTASAFGGVDILVNNAAIDPRIPFLDLTEGDWDRIVGSTLKGAFLCAKQAVPMMASRGGGRIINISSVHGQVSAPQMTAYAAAKGGLNMFTRQLAVELAPLQITVNAIAPGVIEIPKYYTQFEHYDRDALAAKIPAGRVGWPSDVSPAVLFLAADEASFVTGQVIVVDGGTTSKLAL